MSNTSNRVGNRCYVFLTLLSISISLTTGAAVTPGGLKLFYTKMVNIVKYMKFKTLQTILIKY